jgi:two-component system, NtrC family, sensor kinase
MRVARKHTAALVFGIFTVMAGYAYWQFRQEVVLFQADLQRTKLFGRTVLISLEQIWRAQGETAVREVIQRARQIVPGVKLRLVSLDAPPGDPARPALTDRQLDELAAGKIVQFIRRDEKGVDWTYTYASIPVAGARPAAVELAESLKPEVTYLRMNHWAVLLATLAVVAVCALIITGLDAWLVGRPMRLLRDKLQRAGAGDLSRPLVLRQRDEIGELAQEINAMCERIAAANRKVEEETAARVAALEHLRHTDRLATVGQLAAGVAHELGTPLNVVSARAQLIAATQVAHPEVVKNAQIIVEQSDRMTDIIHQLLAFSRRRGPDLGLFSLGRIVSRTVDLLSPAAAHAHVALEYEGTAAALLARVDQNQIQQVLTNIILNGIHAMPNGGRLRVSAGTRRARPPAEPERPEDDYLCVTVADEGVGIAPDQLPHIFEPFFTTKGAGEGTGLGLAVAHGIIAEHGGWIAVDSTVGKGSRFSVFLPPPAGSGLQAIEAAS